MSTAVMLFCTERYFMSATDDKVSYWLKVFICWKEINAANKEFPFG